MSHRIVLDLEDTRPVWSMPPWVPDRIREALPADWDVTPVAFPTDGTGDAAGGVSEVVLEAVADARVYVGMGIPGEVVKAGRKLEWAHTITVGVGGSLTPEMLGSDVILTNSAGIHAVPMAETVLALVLHFLRGVDFAVEMKAGGEWDPEPFVSEDTPVTELGDTVLGILGYGGIGREVARRASAMGCRVLGATRTPPATGDPFAEVFHGPAGLERVLARSDVVVVCLPETPETRGILDRDALGRMKRGAILVNVARGSLVDDEALVDALVSGRLRGAALDAFRSEPLPSDHPFWTAPNLVLTPHVSAVSRQFWPRQVDLLAENLSRFVAGRPLLNRVDKEAGY